MDNYGNSTVIVQGILVVYDRIFMVEQQDFSPENPSFPAPEDRIIVINHENLESEMVRRTSPRVGGPYAYCDPAIVKSTLSVSPSHRPTLGFITALKIQEDNEWITVFTEEED